MPPRRKRARQASPDSGNEDAPGPDESSSQNVSPITTESEAAKTERLKKFNERWKVATRTDDEVLAAQMKTWTSDAYGHFKIPPEIIYEDGEVKYRFWCLKHPGEHSTRVRTDPSTTNLNKHIKKCAPEVVAGQGSIAQFAAGSTYNKAEFRYLTTVWIARCHRPFAIVDDEPLQDMFRMLYAKVEVPSASTVSRDVKEVWAISKTEVASFLQRLKSAIHIAFDGWTAPNVISYLGVVVSFENEGVLSSLLLDFVRLRKGHDGKYLARKMHECLDSFGISHKIYAQAADNASNNDTMIKALGRRLSGPTGPQTRIRCFCHILNLCVKAILQPFTKRKKQKKQKKKSTVGSQSTQDDAESEEDEDEDRDIDDDDDDDDDDNDNDDNDNDDNALSGAGTHAGIDDDTHAAADQDDSDEYELDPDREASDQAEIADIVASSTEDAYLPNHERLFAEKTLTKVHKLTTRIFHSPVIREDLSQLCTRHGIKPLGVVRPVSTRWNSVAMTSRRAIHLERALNDLVSMASHNGARGARLLRFKLGPEEWELLKQLDAILAYFLEATERMSVRARPLLHEVIPMMDVIEGVLKRAADEGVLKTNTGDRHLKPAVRVAASLGRDVLNRYYSKTDESIMYRCAMILHPRYKTAYFKHAEWEQEWIDTAIELLRKEWKRYKPSPSVVADTAVNGQGLFSALDFNSLGAVDALEEYLITPPIPSVMDPIRHWHSLDSERNPLARMALDILSAPATSVDVERSFSHGGLVVSKLRRNLSDESTRAATVLNEWIQVPGLVPKQTCVQTFKDKASRSKGKGKGNGPSAEDEVVVVD